ncbi:MAG: glutamate--tRNA ligase [Planctomycetota bacterium]
MTVRLRFAPSPTGPLHIGGARTAIYNWAAARAQGGTFLLRIEDTDRERSTAASLQMILEGLRWVGLRWDEGPEAGGEHGPYFQSERLDRYAATAQQLLDAGAAYRCYATPEEVEEGRRALQERGERPMYDRRHRDLTDAQCAEFEAAGRRASLRFRMPLDERVVLPDLCKGDVEVHTAELDDWVMVRADGMPTYNFACVVDDLAMQISHVVRGEEHLMNGVKQMLLYRALSAEPPRFGHIPLILGPSGKKLSKRDAQTNILDYRDRGFPPEALFNYISTLGWGFSGDRDVFSADEMVERFTVEGIGKAGAKFDEQKMMAICGQYVRATPIDELVRRVRPFCEAAGAVPAAAFDAHPDLVANAVACYQERIDIYGELPAKIAWVFTDDLTMDDAAAKNLRKYEAAGAWLAAVADRLEAADLPPSYPDDRGDADRACRLPSSDGSPAAGSTPFANTADLEQVTRQLADELGAKFGHLVHPIRAALTGTNKGPGLFDVMFLLGKQRCLRRLRAHAS